MSSELVSAYVLHSRAYRDTSRIVDLYSLEQGRVSAVFKGVRTVGKKRHTALEPFNRISVALSGRSALKNGSVRESQRQLNLSGSTALFSGLYVNELLVRLLQEGEENLELFAAYEWVLAKLSSEPQISDHLRAFEYTLLQCLGYPLSYQRDANGDAISDDSVYYLDPTEGFITASQAPNMRQYFAGETLALIARFEWNNATRMAAKVINRKALQQLLGNKPLASRQLFKAAQ